MDRGEFFVSMLVTDRRVHLSWEVIIVYDTTDHGRSADFLAELKNKVERCTTPIVVAGDFNLIRWASDKSSPNGDRPRMRLFNDCIADLALREIARVGARFTWSNKQADPIRSVLDRVFVSPQWEVMFPLCCLKAAMKGWGANLGADLWARKGVLPGQIKALDDLADGPSLSPDDWIRRYSLDTSPMDILKSEELFWQRRGGQNWLLKGDANTAYFQAIANGRGRKCAIPFL
ncbi:hypothetical protein D1007_43269 [Hordeum vulgare]|nr:hypothetical protein D1007_43269 [Hordeum vulgare]